MDAYFILATAILSEVFGSSMLKVSSGFKKILPSAGVVIGYAAAFYLLSLALESIPLGTAYAIWSGVGTALTALVGAVFYKERLSLRKCLGLILIISGVVVLKMSTPH